MDGFADTIGIGTLTAQDGAARAELHAEQRHLNPAGTVHGGVLATLVDTAMGAAVRSTTDDGAVAATTQLTIAYLRPGHEGLLTVHARVGKQGQHVLVCEAQVAQDGEALIEALATFAIISKS
ncbi:PaaI family thioesterase [uncultured Jatrophihabitans sp.]|uniref:PaaI family thioesterase n=1 Tax=uncultured Jatrophihabitans sp. TaxID=1610747 RepID=UPI0035CC0E10